MTVNTNLPMNGPFIADGVQTLWPFDFKVLEESHMALVITDAEELETQIFTSNIAVDEQYLDNELGGYAAYPASGDPLPAGTRVYTTRRVPYSQPNRIGNQGRFFPETHEDTFDLLVMQIQQIAEIAGRSVTVKTGATPPRIADIPENHIWKRDADGNMVDGGSVTDVQDASAAAQAAAAAAATSEDNAAASETAAAGSAAGAAASAVAADDSATDADGSAVAAGIARTGAEAAQTAAETAQGAAETAQSAAETAQTGAEAAQTAAETAQGNAEAASSTAVGASSDAQAAAQTAADYVNNLPALGTAAEADAADFATAAQGSKADTAMQPGAGGLLGIVPSLGLAEVTDKSFLSRISVSDPDGPGYGAFGLQWVDAAGRRCQLAIEAQGGTRAAFRSEHSGGFGGWRDMSAHDKATIAYVDAAVSGLGQQIAPVRVATTANITLSGTQTIDGVAVVAGNRVLVKNQSTGAQNGVYVVAAGAWSRATDSDTWDEIRSKRVLVTEGSTQANSGWSNTNASGGTLGTTAITYQLSSTGQAVTGSSSIDVTGSVVALKAALVAMIEGASQQGANLSDLDDKPEAVRNLGVSYPTLAYGATGAGGTTDKNALTALLDDTAADLPRLQRWAQGTIRMSELIPGSDAEPCADYINLIWRHAGLEAALRGAAFVFDKSRAYWMGTVRSAQYAHGNSHGYFIPPRDATIEWERWWEFQDWPLAAGPSFLVRSASMGPTRAVTHHIGKGVTRTITTGTAHGFVRGDRIRIIATTNLNSEAGSFTNGIDETGWSTARAEDHIVHSVQSSTQFTLFNFAEDNYQYPNSGAVVQKYVDEPRLRLINPMMMGPGRPIGDTGGNDRAMRIVGGRNLLIEGGRIEDFGGSFMSIGSIMGGSVRDLECRGTLDSVELGQAIARGIYYGGGMSDFVFDNVRVQGGGQSFMHSGLGGTDTSWAELGISRRVKHRDCVSYGPGLGAFTQHMTCEGLEYERCHVVGGPNTEVGFDVRSRNTKISKCVVRDLPDGRAVSFRHNINGFRADGMDIDNVKSGITLTTFNGDDSYVTPPGDIEITNNKLTRVGDPASAGAIQCEYDIQDGGSYADLGSLVIEGNTVDCSGTTTVIDVVGKWLRPSVCGNRILDGGTGLSIRVYGGAAGGANGPRSPIVTNNKQGTGRAAPTAFHATGTVTLRDNDRV